MKSNGDLSRSVARASKLRRGPASPDFPAASLADLTGGLVVSVYSDLLTRNLGGN
jgi:hypothetical protein